VKLVIDTNIFWVSVSRRSSTNWIFQALINGKFTLCVTTDILLEYEEILSQKLGHQVAESVMKILDNLYNIEFVTNYFFWKLIRADYDDNKFVDCFIACNANYLATNDKHFNVLRNLDFPKINVISLDELTILLRNRIV
jgi:putative PIN family toxin of toxin-antitoxin system